MSDRNEFREAVAETLRDLEDLLNKVPPNGLTNDVRDRIAALRQLLIEQREPRFALVGRRGSGKSSLINAILGEQKAAVGHEVAATGQACWYSYETERGRMRILDTRGLQEGSAPSEGDTARTPTESILKELREKCPDAVLFLIKAKEADAAIDADLDETESILSFARAHHGAPVPVLAVVTNCDELEPKNVRLHCAEEEDARDLEEKKARVKTVESHIESKFRARPLLRDRLIGVIGVSAYQSWRADGSRRADERWRIDDLVGKLVDELPKEARVELVRVSQVRTLQKSLASTITKLMAGICAAVAISPLPISDIIPITSLQVSLVSGIAYISGRTMTLKSAGEFLAAIGVNVGVGFAARELARNLVKLIPVVGTGVSSALAYATTAAIGRAASAYFIDEVSKEDARRVYGTTRDEEERRYSN